MPINACIERGDVHIKVDGESFDYAQSELLIQSLKNLTVVPERGFYRIDLRQVKKVDTNVLGAFLVAREFAKKQKCNISVINCQPAIMTVLHRHNFQKLFPVN